MQKPTRAALVAGLALIAAGWVAIGLAWKEAGAQRLEVGQLPYLLSGGFGGLGLLLLGAVAIVVDQMLQATWRTHRSIDSVADRLETALERLDDSVSGWTTPPRAEDEDEDQARPPPDRRRRRTGTA